MRCPICRIEMKEEKFGDARVGFCKTGCHGIWITYNDLIRIGERNEGSTGFGYDPVFIPRGHKKSFALLGSKVKDRLSHRGKALRGAKRAIERYLARAL